MISSTMDAKRGTVINESVANYESHLDANTTVPTASTMSIAFSTESGNFSMD